MTTCSSTHTIRQPMASETPSNQLQAISELQCFSEQPEDIHSLDTIATKDLSHSRDKGARLLQLANHLEITLMMIQTMMTTTNQMMLLVLTLTLTQMSSSRRCSNVLPNYPVW